MLETLEFERDRRIALEGQLQLLATRVEQQEADLQELAATRTALLEELQIKHPSVLLNGQYTNYHFLGTSGRISYSPSPAEEPGLRKEGDKPSNLEEKDLQSMMRDPKYWREKDPAFVAKVTDGFKRMYGNQ